MSVPGRPYEPPLGQRIASSLIIGVTGALARTFLYGLNKTETHGLDRFLALLDERRDEKSRERGLITVSNHLSVIDDPVMWGVLPFRYHWMGPNNTRWGLASHDICFKNRFTSAFFAYGNTLPTHRMAYSPFGGLFQPTMTQCIRLLSDPHGPTPLSTATSSTDGSTTIPSSDPFSSTELYYSTNGIDSFSAPSAYPSRRYSWIHIFPEGMIHQHPQTAMRYFKWGVARLLLEAEPCPDIVPIWIDGTHKVMDEMRGWPRPVPRPGKRIGIYFGERVDGEAAFGAFRARWRELKERAHRKNLSSPVISTTSNSNTVSATNSTQADELGVVDDYELRYGVEAQQLRREVTLAIRNEVLKVRHAAGFPDEDPKRSLAETFKREGGKRVGVMGDASVVSDV